MKTQQDDILEQLQEELKNLLFESSFMLRLYTVADSPKEWTEWNAYHRGRIEGLEQIKDWLETHNTLQEEIVNLFHDSEQPEPAGTQ